MGTGVDLVNHQSLCRTVWLFILLPMGQTVTHAPTLTGNTHSSSQTGLNGGLEGGDLRL